LVITGTWSAMNNSPLKQEFTGLSDISQGT
jgi:hypothetical protein